MIALEPEAASLYCQYMPVNRFASGGADSQASLASPGTVYMVVDLGGKNNWLLIVLGFNDTSTHEGHFVSSPREREKRDRRESRGDKREGQGRKRNRNESEETEEIKTFPLYPYPLQG